MHLPMAERDSPRRSEASVKLCASATRMKAITSPMWSMPVTGAGGVMERLLRGGAILRRIGDDSSLVFH